MNIETKKKLIALGSSDLVEAIENQENDTSLIGKSFNERIEILSEEISSIFRKDTKNDKNCKF